MWPEFLAWADKYVGSGFDGSAKASYSREDMRYAYQAGYEKSEWVSVNTKMPDLYQDVIVNTKTVGVKIGYADKATIAHKRSTVNVSGHARVITHWMPLPEPPK